jgi:hypothetical protein
VIFRYEILSYRPCLNHSSASFLDVYQAASQEIDSETQVEVKLMAYLDITPSVGRKLILS